MASIDQVNAFISVYETNGYASAAKVLGKGRTTVRELVQTLEDQNNLNFFTKNGRLINPTDIAKKIYPHAKLLQSQLQSFDSLMDSFHEENETKLSFYYDPFLPASFIADVTRFMHEKFPFLELQWKNCKWDDAITRLEGDYSAISLLPMKRRSYASPKVKLFLLGHLEIGFYCGKDNSLLKEEKLTKQILRNHLQIISENMEYSELAYLKHATNVVSVPNNELICEMLTKVGWAVLPVSAAKNGLLKGELVRLNLSFASENSLKIPFNASYCESENRGPAMTYLLDKLNELGKKHFC
jgi:DNA-binding transcriptional LysR family regulator